MQDLFELEREAYAIAKEICDEWGVPTPRIRVSPELPPGFAGMYFDDYRQEIVIHPRYFDRKVVAHEIGHYLYHKLYPGKCKGFSPECEQFARKMESLYSSKNGQENFNPWPFILSTLILMGLITIM